MKFNYAFTEDNRGVRVRYEESEITEEPIPNPGTGRRYSDDLPVGVEDRIWSHIVETTNDADSLVLAIEKISAVCNGDVSKTDPWW